MTELKRSGARAALVAAVLLASVAPGQAVAAPEHRIQASMLTFCADDFIMCPPFFSNGEYRTLVRVGTTVTWYYNDPQCDLLPMCPGHNVTFPDEEPVTVKGAAFQDEPTTIRSRTFDQLGNYWYVCTIHEDQGMTGFIGVIP